MNIDTVKLLVISSVLKCVATITKLPGNTIDSFIRMFAIKSRKKIGQWGTIRLLINPMSAIRYWEFDFVLRQLPHLRNQSILDVSSPRFFGLYIAQKHPSIQYLMINPDKKDIDETLFYKDAMRNMQNFSTEVENAISLSYKNNTFDYVISISVIEHIEGDGDTKAVREMLRVLKPHGKLILTTHVMKKGRVEYRESDQYSLGLKKMKGKYFFQRVYDVKTLNQRIIQPLKMEPSHTEIIGEKNAGWFDDYINRWIKNALNETVFDPWYTMTKFRSYASIESLNGMGVIGLVFVKP